MSFRRRPEELLESPGQLHPQWNNSNHLRRREVRRSRNYDNPPEENEIELLNQALAEKNSMVLATQDEVAELHRQEAYLQDKIEDKMKENDDLRQSMGELEAELKRATILNRQQQLTSQEDEDYISKLIWKNEEIAANNRDLHSQIEEREEMVKALRQEIFIQQKMMEEYQRNQDYMSGELTRLRQQIWEARLERKQWRRDIIRAMRPLQKENGILRYRMDRAFEMQNNTFTILGNMAEEQIARRHMTGQPTLDVEMVDAPVDHQNTNHLLPPGYAYDGEMSLDSRPQSPAPGFHGGSRVLQMEIDDLNPKIVIIPPTEPSLNSNSDDTNRSDSESDSLNTEAELASTAPSTVSDRPRSSDQWESESGSDTDEISDRTSITSSCSSEDEIDDAEVRESVETESASSNSTETNCEKTRAGHRSRKSRTSRRHRLVESQDSDFELFVGSRKRARCKESSDERVLEDSGTDETDPNKKIERCWSCGEPARKLRKFIKLKNPTENQDAAVQTDEETKDQNAESTAEIEKETSEAQSDGSPTPSAQPPADSTETTDGKIEDSKDNTPETSNERSEKPPKLTAGPHITDDPVYLKKAYTQESVKFRSPGLLIRSQSDIMPLGSGKAIEAKPSAPQGDKYESMGEGVRQSDSASRLYDEWWFLLIILVMFVVYIWYSGRKDRLWMEANEVPQTVLTQLRKGRGQSHSRLVQMLGYEVQDFFSIDRVKLG